MSSKVKIVLINKICTLRKFIPTTRDQIDISGKEHKLYKTQNIKLNVLNVWFPTWLPRNKITSISDQKKKGSF